MWPWLEMVKTVPCLPPGTSQLFISQNLLSLEMAALNNSGYGSMPKPCFFLTPWIRSYYYTFRFLWAYLGHTWMCTPVSKWLTTMSKHDYNPVIKVIIRLVLPFLFTANCWRGIIPGWAQKTLQLHPGLCHVGCCSPGLLPSIQELQDITCLQNNHENMILLIGMVVRYLSYIYPLYKSLYLIWLSWYHINITIW